MNSTLVRGRVGCLLFLIGIAWGTGPVALLAADDANPYSVIVERNIFHLNPPPPPPKPEEPKVEVPVVKITGFINIGNISKVLFVSQPKDKKEDPSYYSLAEGEKSGDGKHQFELVKIHPAQDAVDVINDGVAATLTVKDDSLGPVGAPAASEGEKPNRPNGMPGRPMFPPGRAAPPGVPGRARGGRIFIPHAGAAQRPAIIC